MNARLDDHLASNAQIDNTQINSIQAHNTQAHSTQPGNAPAARRPVDEHLLHELLGRIVVDFGAVSIAPLVLIGDQPGLYRALATHGPLTSAEISARTGTRERYVREWLNAQAASGYVHYLADSGHYAMTPEQAMAFADEDGPAFIVGAFQTALAAGRITDRLAQAFASGDGIGGVDGPRLPVRPRSGPAARLALAWRQVARSGISTRLSPKCTTGSAVLSPNTSPKPETRSPQACPIPNPQLARRAPQPRSRNMPRFRCAAVRPVREARLKGT